MTTWSSAQVAVSRRYQLVTTHSINLSVLWSSVVILAFAITVLWGVSSHADRQEARRYQQFMQSEVVSQEVDTLASLDREIDVMSRESLYSAFAVNSCLRLLKAYNSAALNLTTRPAGTAALAERGLPRSRSFESCRKRLPALPVSKQLAG